MLEHSVSLLHAEVNGRLFLMLNMRLAWLRRQACWQVRVLQQPYILNMNRCIPVEGSAPALSYAD